MFTKVKLRNKILSCHVEVQDEMKSRGVPQVGHQCCVMLSSKV